MSQIQKCIKGCKLPNQPATVICYGDCSKLYHQECVNVTRETAFFWKCNDCQVNLSQESSPQNQGPLQTPRFSVRNSQEHQSNALANLTSDNSPGAIGVVDALCDDIAIIEDHQDVATGSKSSHSEPAPKGRLFTTPKKGKGYKSFSKFITAMVRNQSPGHESATTDSATNSQSQSPVQLPGSSSPDDTTSSGVRLTPGEISLIRRLKASIAARPWDPRTDSASSSRNTPTAGTSNEPIPGPSNEVATRSSSSRHSSSQTTGSNDEDDSSEEEVPDGEFAVEEIVKHRVEKNKKIKYLIRWEGYGPADDTWEPEKHLYMYYDMLASYKFRHGLGLPTNPRYLGNTRPEKGNPDNWRTAQDIIDMAFRYTPKKYHEVIQVAKLEKPAEVSKQDMIYLICHNNHALVGLYLRSQRLLIIADGENAYLEDSSLRKDINNWLQVPIRAVKFLYQTKLDHCASSAAILIARFIEYYAKDADIPSTVLVSKDRLNKIRKTMHTEPSLPLKQWTPIRDQEMIQCDWPGCGAKFLERDGRKLNMHMLNHKRSKN